MTIDPNIITSTTFWFKDALNLAESLFGPRDKDWTYIGLEFKEDGPYIMYYPGNRISIVLSTGSLNYQLQFLYQLSHEVCHLLYPTGKADANNLNEGISTYFSRIYQEKHFPHSDYAIEAIKKTRYFAPYNAVHHLLADDPSFILKLRKINSNISAATYDQIKEVGEALDDDVILYLLEKFSK